MSYFNSITQNVIVDSLNSSSASLVASGSFVGIPVSTLGISGIQVSLKTDQNSTLWVEQSSNAIDWDISDPYNYHTSRGNFGVTVQAVSSYYRVIVKNVGIASQAYLRLQSALCPIVEALPRSLTQDGNFKTSIEEIKDSYDFEVENTPSGEMRNVTPYRLVGSSFSGSVIDTNYWTAGSIVGAASASPIGSQIILSTGSQANGAVVLQSVRYARYVGGAANRFRCVVRMFDSGSANNIRRMGAFTTTDGAFFEVSGSSFGVVTRKSGSDARVDNGSFNGDLGNAIVVPTTVRTCEIYWNNSKVWFVIGGDLLHTVSADSNTWTDSLTLPIRFENINSGSSANNVQAGIRSGTIYRLGNQLSQPTSYYHPSGQQTGINLKLGAGNLHSIIVNSVTNNSVMTLADSTSGSSPVITSMVASNTTTTPYYIDFKGLPFYSGLRLIVATANASLTIVYE